MTWRLLIASVAGCLLTDVGAAAAAGGCFPQCRSGFTCTDRGQCAPSIVEVAPTDASSPDVSPPAASETAFAVSLGGGYVPAGVAGPGAASAGILELNLARSLGRGDLRVGVIVAQESTYYQSSLAVFLVASAYHYVGSGVYAWGGGIGFGYASLSPKAQYHADDGSTAELVSYFVPAMLRLGARRDFEIALKTGIVGVFGFGGEVDPFAALSIGFVTW